MSSDPIVAGTDGSPRAERAVDKAAELAQAMGVAVHVVCVPGEITAPEWPARITAQQIVADAAERLQARGVTAHTHLPKGDASLSLIAVAQQENAQMIVMGNKGMTGVRRIFGSLPNRVSHQAQCDVLIVPTKSDSLGDFRGASIVVGTDGSGRAQQALHRALGLAKALGSKLHIVSTSLSESALAATATQAADQGVEAATHALDMDPADALLDVAQKNDAAIVVVGSRGMRSGERELFGNVPDRVSHQGTVSVLIAFTTDEPAAEEEAVTAVAAGGEASASAGG